MTAVELSDLMLARTDELSARMADLIAREVDFYQAQNVVSTAELRHSCAANTHYVFRSLAGEADLDVEPAETTGTARAAAGVPLPAVMAAYRVGFRFMWENTVAVARTAGIPSDSILDATAQILIAHDVFIQAMANAYRQQATMQILDQEEERSALVEALLLGRINETRNLWEAADLLRLPTTGPYVVVAVEVPAIGRLAMPKIANRLDAGDIRSAWRLLPDLQVGIVWLRRAQTRDELVSILTAAATSRIGISPPYDSLGDTSEALRLARLAVAGKPAGSLVTVFEDSPLAFAAVSSPEVMGPIGRTVLGGLNALPAEERAILVETFEAWVEAGGSTNETASKVFCHPNTVRHRLHRIEEHTGRSLARPKDVAELCLAFEIERRLP